MDACHKGGILHSYFPDADCVALTRHSIVIDIDIVIARGEIVARAGAQCSIAVAAVVSECAITNGRVVVSSGAPIKGKITIGYVFVAVEVAEERIITGGRVREAVDVAIERLGTVGRVVWRQGR